MSILRISLLLELSLTSNRMKLHGTNGLSSPNSRSFCMHFKKHRRTRQRHIHIPHLEINHSIFCRFNVSFNQGYSVNCIKKTAEPTCCIGSPYCCIGKRPKISLRNRLVVALKFPKICLQIIKRAKLLVSATIISNFETPNPISRKIALTFHYQCH